MAVIGSGNRQRTRGFSDAASLILWLCLLIYAALFQRASLGNFCITLYTRPSKMEVYHRGIRRWQKRIYWNSPIPRGITLTFKKVYRLVPSDQLSHLGILPGHMGPWGPYKVQGYPYATYEIKKQDANFCSLFKLDKNIDSILLNSMNSNDRSYNKSHFTMILFDKVHSLF